jgi:superfamily II DNA or RNA helicase
MNAPLQTIPMPAQSSAVQPERFQSDLISGMTRALLRQPSPPCLLRAPTGSGKTFVISQVLERVCAQRDVLWFWFVPFVTLVQQTEDALRANAPNLAPYGLNAGRNQDAHPSMVLLSTAQGVARAQWRTKGYDADGDDETRTLAAFVARARARGLQVGLVVDEAHIALDKGTEFGKFAHWLAADYLVMATATPKDDRLNEFLVQARLNKKYIEAVVYSLGNAMAHITDLRRTVLRQAWRRNLKIQQALTSAGISLTPLLLVQVANGDKNVDEAADDLMRLCGVPADAIGRHSADEPDPVLMAAIANDSTKQVLVFKQSAGTGFDAPRAFVLASTKPVNDADFAMQFIGRVMRVARPVRTAFGQPLEIPADLNTAYVYLGNAQAQAGFESAVKASTEVKSQLEGQTEKLLTLQTVSGAVVYSNRPTEQEPVAFDMAIPDAPERAGLPLSCGGAEGLGPQGSLFNNGADCSTDVGTGTDSIWGDGAPGGVAMDEVNRPVTRTRRTAPQNSKELLAELATHGLRAYARKHPLAQLGRSLKTEEKPELNDMSDISRAVATRLEIADGLRATAVKVALNRVKEIAQRAKLIDARPLPDVMVFPEGIALERSAKNIYGVLPPSTQDGERVAQELLMDDRQWLTDKTFQFEDGDFSQGQFDGTWYGNALENAFSRALDSADFVVWWHRNPRNKPYAVRVVRAEHDNYFYPDFVVCVKHNPTDNPMQRLLETKDDTKDAARKAKHSPAHYGKVLFLTPDGQRMKWVNDDGSLGDVLDFDDMQSALGKLAMTRPSV